MNPDEGDARPDAPYDGVRTYLKRRKDVHFVEFLKANDIMNARLVYQEDQDLVVLHYDGASPPNDTECIPKRIWDLHVRAVLEKTAISAIIAKNTDGEFNDLGLPDCIAIPKYSRPSTIVKVIHAAPPPPEVTTPTLKLAPELPPQPIVTTVVRPVPPVQTETPQEEVEEKHEENTEDAPQAVEPEEEEESPLRIVTEDEEMEITKESELHIETKEEELEEMKNEVEEEHARGEVEKKEDLEEKMTAVAEEQFTKKVKTPKSSKSRSRHSRNRTRSQGSVASHKQQENTVEKETAEWKPQIAHQPKKRGRKPKAERERLAAEAARAAQEKEDGAPPHKRGRMEETEEQLSPSRSVRNGSSRSSTRKEDQMQEDDMPVLLNESVMEEEPVMEDEPPVQEQRHKKKRKEEETPAEHQTASKKSSKRGPYLDTLATEPPSSLKRIHRPSWREKLSKEEEMDDLEAAPTADSTHKVAVAPAVVTASPTVESPLKMKIKLPKAPSSTQSSSQEDVPPVLEPEFSSPSKSGRNPILPPPRLSPQSPSSSARSNSRASGRAPGLPPPDESIESTPEPGDFGVRRTRRSQVHTYSDKRSKKENRARTESSSSGQDKAPNSAVKSGKKKKEKEDEKLTCPFDSNAENVAEAEKNRVLYKALLAENLDEDILKLDEKTKDLVDDEDHKQYRTEKINLISSFGKRRAGPNLSADGTTVIHPWGIKVRVGHDNISREGHMTMFPLGREDNVRDFKLGDVVWARFTNTYWPGFVKAFIPANMAVHDDTSTYKADVVMVEWINDGQHSFPCYADVHHFDSCFAVFYNDKVEQAYNKAVAHAIATCGKYGYWEHVITSRTFKELRIVPGVKELTSLNADHLKRVTGKPRTFVKECKGRVEDLVFRIENNERVGNYRRNGKLLPARNSIKWNPDPAFCCEVLGIAPNSESKAVRKERSKEKKLMSTLSPDMNDIPEDPMDPREGVSTDEKLFLDAVIPDGSAKVVRREKRNDKEDSIPSENSLYDSVSNDFVYEEKFGTKVSASPKSLRDFRLFGPSQAEPPECETEVPPVPTHNANIQHIENVVNLPTPPQTDDADDAEDVKPVRSEFDVEVMRQEERDRTRAERARRGYDSEDEDEDENERNERRKRHHEAQLIKMQREKLERRNKVIDKKNAATLDRRKKESDERAQRQLDLINARIRPPPSASS